MARLFSILNAALALRQVVRLEDRELRVHVGYLLSEREAGRHEPLLDDVDDRGEVDGDGVAFDVDGVGPFAGQDTDHLGVRLPVRLDPGIGERIGRHELRDLVRHERPDPARERGRQGAQAIRDPGREPLVRQRRHCIVGDGPDVDALEELCGHPVHHGLLDRWVVRQRCHRLDVPVRVGDHVVRPPGYDRRRREDECREHQEGHHDRSPPAAAFLPVRRGGAFAGRALFGRGRPGGPGALRPRFGAAPAPRTRRPCPGATSVSCGFVMIEHPRVGPDRLKSASLSASMRRRGSWRALPARPA